MPEISQEPSAPEYVSKASHRSVDLIIGNASVLTCDDSMQSIPDGALAIDGGTVVGIGTTRQIHAEFRGRREMSLHNHVVMPGLINTHTHAAMSCLRGLADDLPLDRWLHDVIFPAEAAHVCPQFVYWGTLLAAAEMLLNGITTFCDGYFYEEEATKAAADAGGRAILGQGVLDLPSPDCPDPARARHRIDRFLADFPRNNDRLRPSLFCHAPYTCSPETLQWVKGLCSERDLLFQTHLSETAGEVDELIKRYGCRPAVHLDRLGVLDGRTLCAHAIWLDGSEMELLAERGVGIAHCPESNMKLASGIAPIPAMLAARMKVGLGTDGCASNNNLDLFAEMDMAAKLHKVHELNPVCCSATEILHMATLAGAQAIGWEKEIGSMEVGKKADMIAINMNQPHLTPVYEPVSHAVYAVSGADVRYVWVNGQTVVADGRIQTIDLDEVFAEIRALSRRIIGS